MDTIIFIMFVIILVGIVAVLYACCCMSSKIDRLTEQENIEEQLEKLKKEKYYEDN